jgi:hypothetical protein
MGNLYIYMLGLVHMLRKSKQVASYTFLSGMKWVKIKFKTADLARRFLIPQNYRQVIYIVLISGFGSL